MILVAGNGCEDHWQTGISRGALMELKTFRLCIRDLREADQPKMKSLFIDFNASKYAAYDRPLPTEDIEIEALTKQFVENSLFFAI